MLKLTENHERLVVGFTIDRLIEDSPTMGSVWLAVALILALALIPALALILGGACDEPDEANDMMETSGSDESREDLESMAWTDVSLDPDLAGLMSSEVSPRMVQILGSKPCDPETREGFGCFGCHQKL